METTIRELPTLCVDWESGAGTVELGNRLENAPPRLRWDVLMDWRLQIDHLLIEADRALHPEHRSLQTQVRYDQNARRRLVCEQLSGQTVVCAEPLINGDVLLHLRGGRHVVVYAHDEDVKLEVATSAAHVRRHAAGHGTGDFYVRESDPRPALRRGLAPAPR
jgi:hypothetical protein